jgi:hypothetical protein
MNIDLYELLPERPSDREINNLAIFLMELALEFEKQHAEQIRQYYRELEINMQDTPIESDMQDYEYPF